MSEVKKESKIKECLKDFDVPSWRKENLKWIYENLGKRNSNHPNYNEVMSLLKEVLFEKNLIKSKELK